MVQTSNLALNNFKIETQSILTELQAYHGSKKRQIEHCFQKLFDNIPSQIINAPINKCIDEYLTYIHGKENGKEARNTEINDQSYIVNENENGKAKNQDETNFHFDDAKDLIDKNHVGTNLTSTVKKINPTKNFMKQKLESIINEQSIIQEVNSDEMKADGNQSNDYRLKIVCFLRDLTQVQLQLKDLNTIDTRQVHGDCIDDLNLLRQALKSNNKK